MRRFTLSLTAAAAALTLTGCGALTPAPTATVTVTATPSAEAAAAPIETTPPAPTPSAEVAGDPAQAAASAPAPASTPKPAAPTVPAPNTPAQTAGTEGSDQGVSIVASEGMEGDDYIIHLVTPAEVLATQNHAPGILASRVRSLTGTPQAKNIDLVAVFGSDGSMVTSTRLPDGKYAGATSGL